MRTGTQNFSLSVATPLDLGALKNSIDIDTELDIPVADLRISEGTD